MELDFINTDFIIPGTKAQLGEISDLNLRRNILWPFEMHICMCLMEQMIIYKSNYMSS